MFRNYVVLCLLLLNFLFAGITVSAQDNITVQDSENFVILRKQAVLFYNGNRSFQENKLWGIKAENGSIIVAAQYDSILNGGPNHCIVYDTTGYNLLDSIGRKCFKVSQPKMLLKGNTISVLIRGHISNYDVNRFALIPRHSGDIDLVVFPIVPKEKPANKIPENEFVWQRYYDLGEYVDSMHLYMNGKNYTRKVFYMKDGKVMEMPHQTFAGMLGDFHMNINTLPRFSTSVVNLLNGDTVLQGDFLVSYIENKEQGYFWARKGQNDTTFVYNLSGKLEFVIPKNVFYESGLIYERIPMGKQTNKFNVYQFPDCELLEKEVFLQDQRKDYRLFADYKNKSCYLYWKDKKIGAYAIKKNERIELLKLDDEDQYIEISITNEGAKDRKIIVLRENGNVLLETPFDDVDKGVYWHSDYQQLHYSYGNERQAIGLPGSDRFIDLEYGYSFDNQLAANVFSVVLNGRIYLRDLEGNNLFYPDGFTEFKRYPFVNKNFYQVHFDDSILVLNHEFKKVEEALSVYELYSLDDYGPKYSAYALIRNQANRFEIIDRNGNRVSKDAYLAVYQVPEAKFFVALTADNMIEYISYND